MGDRPAESVSRDIDALFRLGVVSGMSDGQLLERFASQSDPDGQLAFEAIVRRHGPMVLGICLRVLGHYQAAEDAFQATFLVLALRARAVRKRESLGPWLHGVAARISRRALISGRRIRNEPLPSGDLVDPATRELATSDLGAVLDEEVGRLPDRYRLPVVLCYLEGQTQEEAARTLGWTKGTVSGRLARAKDLLRHRLTKRGVAPTVGLLAASLTPQSASAAVPASLLLPTVRAATAAALGGAEAGLVTGQVASLARRALKVMLLGRLVRAATLIVLVGMGAVAVATPMIMPGGPARGRDLGGGPGLAGKPAPDRPTLDPLAMRLDRSGDPLPPGVRMRLGTTQRRHAKGAVGIDFTRDGKTAVSAQPDGLVRFWDNATGREVRTVDMLAGAPMLDPSVRSFAISPDGGLMAAAGFGFDPERRLMIQRVWIRDLRTDEPRRTLEVNTLDLFCVAFSPDGKTLATGGFRGDVQLWDVATGDRRSALKLGGNNINSLAFSPDGKTLAAGEVAKGIRLWNLEQGRETLMANARSSSTAPLFSPDGRLMATNELGGQFVLRERGTDRPRFQAKGFGIAYAPDGRSLAAVGDNGGTLMVLDAEDGHERWKADLGWGLRATASAFSPDGKTILALRGGVLRFFETESGRERFASPEAHQGGVSVIRYTSDGRAILTAGDDGTVRHWDAAIARQIRVIPHGGRVHRLAVAPDGRTIATATVGPEASVSIWDLETGRLRQKWPAQGNVTGAEALAFSTDGESLLTIGRDRVLKVREVATGRERTAVQPRFGLANGNSIESLISRAAFAPGNRLLAISTTTNVSVADLVTGEERFSAPSFAMAFAPDGRNLAVATPGKPEERKLANGRSWINGWIADGVDLVDLGSGRKKRIEIPRDLVVALAFSPDGQRVAVAGGWRKPMIRLYRTDDGRLFEAFTPPASLTHPGGLAFAPDGRSLAAGLEDTTVLIWDVRDVR
jgi:RNA polymerase sigma factor (sigma-70 family)